MNYLKSVSQKQLIIYGILIVFSVLLPLLITQKLIFGPLFILLLLFLPILISILVHYSNGILALMIFGSFIFFIDRILPVNLPLGILYDFLILVIFFALIIQIKGKEKFQWKLNEPVTWANIIFYFYFALQLVNPNATSIKGWIIGARIYVLLFLFFVLLHFFINRKNIKYFIYLWLGLALIIALYGLYQEYLGLPDFEMRWVRKDPQRYATYFQWGHLRKYSFLSDPSAFGIFLGFSSLGSLVMIFGPYSNQNKVKFAIITASMLLSMTYSGTRTAYAMVMVGVVFFILLNIRNKKIMFASVILVVGFIALMFGPFYSGPINRIRSTFNLSGDGSMGVRDVKRIRFQPYVQRNPMGGGINTAGNSGLRYSRNHPLAGRFDPDSGYLRTAMEMGTIGLIILLGLNCTVLITGINNHFSLHDPFLKIVNLAFIVPFIGISLAHYTQDALLQKPINILVAATMAVVIKLKDLDTSNKE